MATTRRLRLVRLLASSLRAAPSIRFHSRGSSIPLPKLTRTATWGVAECGGIGMKLQTPFRYFSSSEESVHNILQMPALSPTMNQGNIVRWRKKEGDKIEVGDVICEIETDKATLEFESLEEGYLVKILVPEGSKDVNVGQPIAITVEDANDIQKVPGDIVGALGIHLNASTDDLASGDLKNDEKTEKINARRISPSAKLLIEIYGLDVSQLKASGPRQTLLKGDVLAAIKSGVSSSRAPPSSQPDIPSSSSVTASAKESLPQPKVPLHVDSAHEDTPNSQIRKIIAKRLLESKKNTPHMYLSSDAILDPILGLREQLKEQHGIKVSVNDIIVKAVALALRSVPAANAYWDQERGDTSVWDSVDIAIAVATEKGLMTPIIRNADQKSLSAISTEIKELAEKARAGKLSPSEFQGGTFSISNLGMFPIDQFSAIINPPQGCILAVGRGHKVVDPVLNSDGTYKLATVTKVKLSLSADNRAVDSHIGGKFLESLASNLREMERLVL